MSLVSGLWRLAAGLLFLAPRDWLLIGTEADPTPVSCNWSSVVGRASAWRGEALAKTGARRDIPRAKETLSPRISNTEDP